MNKTPKNVKSRRDPNRYPRGLSAKRVREIIAYHDSQSDADAAKEAVEDALDLMDLEEARRESAGQKLVPWEDVKRRLGVGGKRQGRTKREGSSRRSG